MHKNLKNLIGKRFTNLEVKNFCGINNRSRALWLCLCDCGIEKVVSSIHLLNGHTKSCGCLRKKTTSINFYHHGFSRSNNKTYIIWKRMHQRCNDPNDKNYKNYGGRGITICKRWKDFKNFIIDMGKCPGPKYSIDRIDNNKGYYKGNCRWATQKEQARNKRNNHLITYNNRIQCLSAWAEELNINAEILRSRIYKYNWSIEKAMTTTARKN